MSINIKRNQLKRVVIVCGGLGVVLSFLDLCPINQILKRRMKKFLFAMIAFAAVLSFAACNDSETYKDMRDRELDSISSFLRKENIKVISEDEFNRRWKNNEKLTDTAKNNNEWVLFNSNGIYMQVIDQGCGDYIKKGTSVDVLVRFDEYNLSYAAEMSDKCRLV